MRYRNTFLLAGLLALATGPTLATAPAASADSNSITIEVPLPATDGSCTHAAAAESEAGGGDVDVALEDNADVLLDPPVPASDVEEVVEKPIAPPSPAHVPSPKPKRMTRRAVPPPPAEPPSAWWTASDAGLKVGFVGPGTFGSAIVLLAESDFADASGANQEIRVKDVDGRVLKGKWVKSQNPRMLVMPVEPGPYTVSIGAGLADASGKTVGQALQGSVYIR